ncbi:NGG1p interacting factor NIF3 [Xylanimonas oleitrophica]|uniref:GTP cyclohydrolase 1 type 2 homolog n=1 Tax=Xylanimonas oleitrophica TaxID=2607479 RepID=A0A2W5WY32_9MICO|nr:Nif3-like dinuclear metal center hexameric protein [Xylanimonas oleitrophica]PZR53186.1 NGG1p interacting factor NIF3 [Xylanimonas oleitrophica]
MTATAADVVDAVRAAIPAPVRERTVDTFLDGDPATPVTGVAVTMTATSDVLRRAAGAGTNLVITHEPLYYDHADAARTDLEAEADPVYLGKRALVAERGLVVWHLHDQWHDVCPDAVDAATAAALGWVLDPGPAAEGLSLATVPPTTLGDLARHVAATLGATALRYVGDPQAVVERVGLDLGFRGAARNRALLRRDDVDVVVAGEVHEWETGGYAVDAVAAGVSKGLVVVGHVPSEQAGMAAVADWLPGVLTAAGIHVPVRFVPTPDTFRTL